MQTEPHRELCRQCVSIARQAGDKIMAIYRHGFEVRHKADRTPLTEADLAAHHHILDALQSLTPALPVLSEEAERPAFHHRRQWQTYWLIDPLDGTREFVGRNGEFTVNIALIHRHRSVLGVVHAPAHDTTYFAWRHGGSFRQRGNRDATGIRVRGDFPEQRRAVILSSRSHPSPLLHRYLQTLGETESLVMGSSLKFCLLAEGRADLYPRLSPTAEWDSAAAHCIVDEAGGCLRQIDVSPLRYNTRDSLLNPHFLACAREPERWLAHWREIES